MWNRYRQQIEVPAYEEKKEEQLVKEAKKIEYSQKKLRMTTREFFWNQLKFIRPGVWGMKIALILVMFLFLFLENIDGRHWIVFSISGPLLSLIGVQELCDLCLSLIHI